MARYSPTAERKRLCASGCVPAAVWQRLCGSGCVPSAPRRRSGPVAVDRPRRAAYSRFIAEVTVTTSAHGAYVRLGDGEVRDSVELGALEDADRIPALDSLTLHFDHYGRLTALEVVGTPGSVLPPPLLTDSD